MREAAKGAKSGRCGPLFSRGGTRAGRSCSSKQTFDGAGYGRRRLWRSRPSGVSLVEEGDGVQIVRQFPVPEAQLTAGLEEGRNVPRAAQADHAFVELFGRHASLDQRRLGLARIADELAVGEGVADEVLGRLVLRQHRRALRRQRQDAAMNPESLASF